MRAGRTSPVIDAGARCAGAVTDGRVLKRVGSRYSRRPASGNRRQHLHCQSEQDQGKEFLQPRAHSPSHSFACQLNTPQSPSRGHFANLLGRSQNSRTLCPACQPRLQVRHLRQTTPQHHIHRFLIFVIYLGGMHSDHFVNCSNFEQSLPKMMTSEKS